MDLRVSLPAHARHGELVSLHRWLCHDPDVRDEAAISLDCVPQPPGDMSPGLELINIVVSNSLSAVSAIVAAISLWRSTRSEPPDVRIETVRVSLTVSGGEEDDRDAVLGTATPVCRPCARQNEPAVTFPGSWQTGGPPVKYSPRPRRASGAVNRWLRADSVRHMSVTAAMQGLMGAHRETQRNSSKNAREAGKIQLTGCFRWWWQVLGSNQRRLSRRFYRPRIAFHHPWPNRRVKELLRNHALPVRDLHACPAATLKPPSRRRPKLSAEIWQRIRLICMARTVGTQHPRRYQHRFSARSGNNGN